MESHDDEIIESVLAGDRERFGALVEKHGRSLLAFLVRRSGNRETARELFQESWVAAFSGLSELRDRAGFRGWLLSIGQRLALKARRRAASASLDSVDEPQRFDAALMSSERRELGDRIADAVASLPQRQREVFELRAVSELSHVEIAELLAISEETSRANYYQAVRKLRDLLGDELG